MEAGDGGEELVRKVGGGIEEMLAVVEDDER